MRNPNHGTRFLRGILPWSRNSLAGCTLLAGLLFAPGLHAQEPPANPSNLSATGVSTSQINLTWDDNSGDETGFEIERKEGLAGTYTSIHTTAAEAESYSDTGLNPNTQYYYRVRATSGSGPSGYSNEDDATTDPNVPAAPSDLAATAAHSNQVDLSWTDNSGGDDQELGFKIERKTGLMGSYSQIGTAGAEATVYSDNTTLEGIQYYYRVRAHNNLYSGETEQNSAYSNEDDASTPPDEPTNMTATTLSNTQINLIWTDESSVEDGFKLEFSTDPGFTSGVTEVNIAANLQAHSVTGLLPGTTYYFRIRAYKGSAFSPYSNIDDATTLNDPPAAPSSLTALGVSSSQIDLSWSDNSSNESGFRIERKLTSAPNFTEIATVGAGVTTYNDNSGLSANTNYSYRVQAFNNGGNSAYTNTANATTLPNPPVAPSGLNATAISNSQIDLSWSDNSSDESGFRIERKTGMAGVYAEIATVGAGATSYSNTGLSGGTQYFYQVRAFNAGGNSAYSNEDDATTPADPPVAPSGLSATAVSANQINLAWTDNSSNETGFRIELKVGPGGTYSEIATTGANATSYMSTGLNPSTQYFYRVRAFNGTGNSAFSNEANATTFPALPAAPSSLTGTPVSSTQIDLNWVDNAGNEDGFTVERKLSSGATYTVIATLGPNVTSYASLGLTANTAYDHRVRAFNTTGNSAYATLLNTTTLPNPPAAPSGLTANALNQSKIDLNWTDNSDNEDGFRIERKTGLLGTYLEITTVGPNVTNYCNTGLDANTQYFYRVRAYNTGGNSGYSNEDDATTLDNPPVAPTDLFANALSNTQINLAWTDNSGNETGFEIERGPAVTGPFSLITTVPANDVDFLDTGLSGSTQYFYRIRAINGTGPSGYSNVASAITHIDPPTAPNNLRLFTVGNSQVDLLWHDNASTEQGFHIERKIGAGGTYSVLASNPADDSTYTDAGLAAGTTFYYRVTAFNAGGNSAYTNEVNVTTPPGLPAAPSSLIATPVSTSQIDLAWTDNSGNETGFKIERSPTGTMGTFVQIAAVGANVTTYSNTGLTANTQYFYRVRAYNGGGNSAYSGQANATTFPPAPAAPSALTAMTLGSTQVQVTWTDNASDEAGFKIERKIGAGGTFAEIGTVGANVTTYQDNSAAAGTQYFYRVHAHNAGGNSGYSNEDDVTTLAGPTVLTATAISHNQINLTWTDNSTGETGFRIERKTGPGGTFAEIATVSANAGSYSSTGLAGNTQYFYRVRAYNADGNSNYSNEANATTLLDPPGVPSGLSATAVSGSQINLSWTDNATNEAGFKIERKIGAGGTWGQIDTAPMNATSYADGNVVGGTHYFYRVRSYNVNWDSPFSNEADATPPIDPLAPPTNLDATTISNTQIDIVWNDNSSTEDGFKIESRKGIDLAFTEIATVGPNVTSFQSTGLSGNVKYLFRVRAFQGANFSAYSDLDSALTFMKGPANLVATAVSSSQIDLTWNDLTTNETGFSIERKTGMGGTFAEVGTAGANATSFSNTGLTAGTQYCYRVRATSPTNVSTYTDEACATPGSFPEPSGLTATPVAPKRIDLSWTDNSSTEDGFKIERKKGVGGTFAQIATVGPNVTSYINNTGLIANSKYFYRVRAFQGATHSAYSDEANALTLIKGPANLVATAVSSSQINLTWTDQTSNESGYKIERKTGVGGVFAEVGTAAANATSFSNTGLAANTQYFYRVRAFTATNFSTYSNQHNATTPGGASNPPAAPSGLAASPVDNREINLTWTDNASDEDGFKIERKTGAAGTFEEIALVGANVTNFASTSLNPNTQYFYRVRAHNSAGHSAYSNEDGAKTFMKPPSELAATTISNSQINLTWTDGIAGESGFKIERKTGAGGTFVEIASVGTNVISFPNTGLASGTQYFYRVRAFNANNVSLYSNEANATTSGPAKSGAADSSATVAETGAAIPEGITLAPNYPNPFNPSTTITFTLDQAMHVKLSVINVNGQVVEVLVNGYQSAGMYRRIFKAADLPSGIYYAVLKAGSVTRTQRMSLTK